MTARLSFGLLGALRVEDDGGLVVIQHGKQRVLLAGLLLSANRAVPREALAAQLWGTRLPADPRGALSTYVMRLRRTLGRGDGTESIVRSLPSGYLIDVQPERVDALRFTKLLDAARAEADAESELSVLQTALGMWRGPALADVESDALRDEYVAGLEEQRLQAVSRTIDIELALQRHNDLIGGLLRLTTEHPLREQFWRQLMIALYRGGQPANALSAFNRLRATVVEETGLEPTEETRRLQQMILNADPLLDQPAADHGGRAHSEAARTLNARTDGPRASAARPTPQQLPSDIRGFVGRDEDIAVLDKMIDNVAGPDTSAPVVISAIDGTAGIGKTALAVHWCHRVKHHFADGQLYLNLRGYGPGEPVRPVDALAAMLRSLGVESDRMPADVDERSALLRSKLTTRRMLVLLDNARDSDQVKPLLPGSDAVVVVTSRRKLHALSVRDGARHLTLDLPTESEALALFTEAVGADRVDREAHDAVAIIRLCARLPLAVRLAAERANRQPASPLGDLAGELIDRRSRLEALSIDDGLDTNLRSIFALSYTALDPEAARMFDLIGLHPGNGISVLAAAAFAGVSPARAAAILRQLTNLSMLEERFRGRFHLHDLLREYAREHAEQHGRDDSFARRRLLQWYIHTADNARGRLATTPHKIPVVLTLPDDVTAEQFSSYQNALEWFDAEHDAIVGIVRAADDHGLHEEAAVLGMLTWHYFYLRGLWQDMLTAGTAGVDYAVTAGNPLLEARISNSLSAAYGYVPGFKQEEIATSRHALSIFERLADREGQAGCLLNLGASYYSAERYSESRECLERAHDLYELIDDPLHIAFALCNLSNAYRKLDRIEEALQAARRAVDSLESRGDPFRLVQELVSLADAHAADSDPHAAIRAFRDALALAERIGNTYQLIPLRIRLGHQLRAAGATNEATDVWREAYQICLAQEDPAAEELRRLLAPER